MAAAQQTSLLRILVTLISSRLLCHVRMLSGEIKTRGNEIVASDQPIEAYPFQRVCLLL